MIDTEPTELRDRALDRLKKKREFQAHLFAYLFVNAFLVAIWAMTGAEFFWPIFPILGWGIGLFFHGWETYTAGPREERIRREMDHLRAAR